MEVFGRDRNNNEAWWVTTTVEPAKFGVTSDWAYSNVDNRALTRDKFRISVDPTADGQLS